MEHFIPIPTAGLAPTEQLSTIRLNSLGSLYYFNKVALRRRRLVEHLHLPVCRSLERRHIKDVYEWPRDHFKSTIASEGYPMWRVLPFVSQDEDAFKKLGYSDEYIAWMKWCHDPNLRFLLVSENITNASKLGKRIRWHFESNAIFRALFPEILPDTSCTWTNYSLEIKRPSGGHGEGTFDFLGVGGALQSRHYSGGIIEDDLVGRKALESVSIMDSTIDYHRLVVGAFESEDRDHEGNELVIGNRWAYHDLNAWIYENEPWFVFTRHSALGGCCPLHPPDQPIFPEEFSFEKLQRIKQRLGNYFFSCQFLNNPSAPEDADFDVQWLNYYSFKSDLAGNLWICHEEKDGIVRRHIRPNSLVKCIITDPAHSGNSGRGRCRHAIVVVGLDSEGNWYLLDTWALACGYDAYFAKMIDMAKKWQLRKIGFETVAAQKFAAYHLQHLNRTSGWPLKVVDLKGEVEGPDGEMTRKKEWRIRTVLAPVFEAQRFWVQRRHQDFIGEYQTFPHGRFVDQLDAMAYVPQLIKHAPMDKAAEMALLAAHQEQMKQVGRPYTVQ